MTISIYLQQLAAAIGFLTQFIPKKFILSVSLLTMFFHTTITYDILCGKGATIGKRYFPDSLRIKASL